MCHAKSQQRFLKAFSIRNACWPSPKHTAFAQQSQEAPQMQEHLLVEQLCCELLRSGSLECNCECELAGSTCTLCQAGSPPFPPPHPENEDPWAIAAATTAVVALLQGRGSAAAPAPALSGLFPSARAFEVALPAAAGGTRAAVPLPPGAGGAAAVRSSAPARLQPVVFAAARCTLTSPAPLPRAEHRWLSAFAAELGRALGQALKERREEAHDCASEALRQGTLKPTPAALLVGNWPLPSAGSGALVWA